MRCSTRGLLLGLVIPALAILPLAGCFDSANTNQLSCTSGKYCPGGYVCVAAQPGSPGKCQKLTDAGPSDTTVVADSADGRTITDSGVGIDPGADSTDDRASTDGPVPPSDGPTTNADTSVVIDQAPSPDIFRTSRMQRRTYSRRLISAATFHQTSPSPRPIPRSTARRPCLTRGRIRSRRDLMSRQI